MAHKEQTQNELDRPIWAEMARRKVQFHPEEEWNEIRLWGLFNWKNIKHLLESGELKTKMHKGNVTVWVVPSLEAWESKIKPLIGLIEFMDLFDRCGLDELSKMAGWIT